MKESFDGAHKHSRLHMLTHDAHIHRGEVICDAVGYSLATWGSYEPLLVSLENWTRGSGFPPFLKLSLREMWTRSLWALCSSQKNDSDLFGKHHNVDHPSRSSVMLLIIFKTKYFTIERRDVHFASYNSKLHHWVWAYSVNMSRVAIFPSPAIYREHNESVNRDNLLQISQYCRGLKHRPCLHTNALTDWMLLSRSTGKTVPRVSHKPHCGRGKKTFM